MDSPSFTEFRAELGEGPLWDAGRQCLWFVDIMRGHVHQFDPAAGHDAIFEIGQPVGALALTTKNDLICAVRDGFVRLDTETGAVSHCKRIVDTWHCDAIAEDKAALERQVQTLSRQVDALTAEVGGLREQLATLKAAPAEPQTKRTPDEEREFDKAMGFAERLMKRFFEMVRDLKGDEKQSI